MFGTLKNYYEILGVPRTANADQIRTAYRKLLLKFHPDKNVGDDYFEDWSKKINEAFEVLINPEVRSEYDKVYDESKLSRPQPPPASPKERESHAPQPDAETTTSPKPPVVDKKLEDLASAYVSEKKAYIKSIRNLENVEKRIQQVKKSNKHSLQITLCFAILLFTLIWMMVSYINGIQASKSVVGGTQEPTPQAKNGLNAANTAGDAKMAEVEHINQEFKVMAFKAYFGDQPGGAKHPAKFLSMGNKFRVTKKQGNFYYGIF